MDLSGESGEFLLRLLRFSLQATASDSTGFSQEHAVSTASSNAGRSRLVQGILFSRSFILSYQLVLLSFLLLFTVWHWTSRIRVRGTRRRPSNEIFQPAHGRPSAIEGADAESRTSSSSSTIIGSSSSPKALRYYNDNEQTPLLERLRPPARGVQIIYWIRAFLIYQPRPIPLVNKTLPSNGTTMSVLVFLGLQVFYVFYKMPLSIPTLFVFADRTSLLFVANLPLLYLFAAKNQPLKLLTGYSYESLNIFHRRLGEVMCLLALTHSVGMVGVWYTILRPTGFSLARFLLSKIILLGIGALVAYELLYVTSRGSFRQRWYELFLVLHVALQVIALVLVWFHHHNSKPYVAAALAIFLIDRLIYRVLLKIHSSKAMLEVCKDEQTVLVRTTVIISRKWRLLAYLAGSRISGGWKATEHVFLTVPALSRKYIVQAHPFTIASRAPNEHDTAVNLKLIIRAQDGFSGDLVRYAKRHSMVNVRIDGPYGSQSALHLLQQCDLSVIVAGGSGIAVALPLVWELYNSRSSIDLEDFTGKKSSSRIILIWVTRYDSHTAWADSTELQFLQDHGVEVSMPPPTADNGHPDVSSMVESWISGHDDTLYDAKAKIGVVCSGPDGMNRAIRNTCSSLLTQGNNVDVEVEKFGW
ncbi:MAG: hypothetical protein LQ343_003532 [Gyalolechia ehrenbergii]|nr:MAG: hypothetical protein LQ343_003532 [Gyalolechia ehrenbergii]